MALVKPLVELIATLDNETPTRAISPAWQQSEESHGLFYERNADMLPLKPVKISRADLRKLCDMAEAKGYSGPVHEVWDDMPDGIYVVTPWLHQCMSFGDSKPPFSLNGGRCIRIMTNDWRADIDLADWRAWESQELEASQQRLAALEELLAA